MRNEDNDCIRYLMKEMDPSEEVLMERAMMEDEDLLIEVESMRQTLHKLDDLPQVKPPSHLTESIIEEAARRKKHTQRSLIPVMPAVKYTMAAAVALTITAGGLWFTADVTSPDKNISSGQETAPEKNSPVNSALVSTQSFDASILPVNESGLSPWVDRDDVIRFEDQFSENKNEFDSILQTSTQKLRPLNDTFNSGSNVRSLRLTGAGSGPRN